MSSLNELALLRDLVATPSVSGTEGEVARLVEGVARGGGLDVVRDDTGVKIRVSGRGPGPVLGHPTIMPTMVEAGVGRNVTPPQARAVLDVRSTPAWTHGEIAGVLRRSLASEVIVTSDRLVPCQTPDGSRLVASAAAVRPQAARFGSPTCSDWVFLRHCDAFKCGPGTSRRSHTADEYVDLPEVTAARAFYAALAQEYLQ